MKKLVNSAFVYMIIGLFSGVFYREYTKILGFEGRSTLSVLHTHTLILGMFFFLIATLFSKDLDLERHRKFRRFFLSYNIGLVMTIVMMFARGMVQVQEVALSKGLDAAISGMSGLGHIILTIGLFTFFSILRDSIES